MSVGNALAKAVDGSEDATDREGVLLCIFEDSGCGAVIKLDFTGGLLLPL